jgi:SAM-dependent methyltransferase
MRNKCPICETQKNKKINKIEIRPFEDSPFDNYIDIVSCSTCDFGFTKNISFNEKDLEIYYANLSKYSDKNNSTGGGQNLNDSIRLKQTAQILKDFLNDKTANILDVGCSNGGLLLEMKKLGFKNLLGVDPSLECVENTINIGINARQGKIRDIEKILNNDKFDLIIFSHVYEHLLNPKENTVSLEKFLNKNGKVYIECPDADSYIKKIHSPFQEFNTEHINHFSVSSLKNLFLNNGYDELQTGVKTLKIDSGDYYACFGMFEKRNKSNSKVFNVNGNTYKSLSEYNNISKIQLKNIHNQINNDINPNFPLAFYGTGQFCMKLLALNYTLPIEYLFDGSYINWERKINNITVSSPESIKNHNKLNLVITSIISSNKIENIILKKIKEINNINIIKISDYE